MQKLEKSVDRHRQQLLSIMGITQWRVREIVLTSPHHEQCHLRATLTQPLTSIQKTFLMNLYQAIEKLLKLSPSSHLIQKNARTSSTAKIQLLFNSKIASPGIRIQSSALIIDLPNIDFCQKTPTIKAELWKILKNHVS